MNLKIAAGMKSVQGSLLDAAARLLVDLTRNEVPAGVVDKARSCVPYGLGIRVAYLAELFRKVAEDSLAAMGGSDRPRRRRRSIGSTTSASICAKKRVSRTTISPPSRLKNCSTGFLRRRKHRETLCTAFTVLLSEPNPSRSRPCWKRFRERALRYAHPPLLDE